MQSISHDSVLAGLWERVQFHAANFGRSIPEIRFFVLQGLEFASLLEKNVYPTSPATIWEGRRMVHKKHRIETGQESSLYYEVVQTGDPSYAYLNADNNPVTQASVMAHVVGHCEFSELNVLRDATPDRTERVMHMVRKVDRARRQMGKKDYLDYCNAVESAASLMSPNSQYNLQRSVETETKMQTEVSAASVAEEPAVQPVFETLTKLLTGGGEERAFERELRRRRRSEALSRRGFVLKAPCQDVLNFIRYFAPSSESERSILDYNYVVRAPQDFVMRTQIMNEGWAMYWEKKLMMELFKERSVAGIIDYARVFSGVCSARPYFQRNPYHLGYNLWTHIEQLYREGKMSLSYREETDRRKKEDWSEGVEADPVLALNRLVRTVTDYEFLRRFLTPNLIHEFHLNRIDRRWAPQLGIKDTEIYDMDEQWIWLNPEPIKEKMLSFYTHFFKPRIYVVDSDFQDGGLLLFHRDDGRELKKDWIEPTLRNLNVLWKAPAYLISRSRLYTVTRGSYDSTEIEAVTFDSVVERMRRGEKPCARK